MKNALLMVVATAAAALHTSGSQAQTIIPALYVHQTGFGTMPCVDVGADDPPCSLPSSFAPFLPNVVGGQLSIPWSAVENTTPGVYDWTRVENVIRPWVAAGKKVALTFHSVEENVGADDTGIPATPDYLLNPPAGTAGPVLVNCTAPYQGQNVPLPTVPVYWDPLFRAPWVAFIQQAIQYFANRPEIAYLRFGVGEGDESQLENMTIGNGGQGKNQACTNNWNAADRKVTGSTNVYTHFLANSLNLIDNIGTAAANTSGAPPISGAMNDLGSWETRQQPQPHPYADQLTVEYSKNGMWAGNEGFGNQKYFGDRYSSKFGDIYTWLDPYLGASGVAPPLWYMQTNSPQAQNTFVVLPDLLLSAMNFHIPVFEMYTGDLWVAFDPDNTSGHNPYLGTHPSRQCLSTQVIQVLEGLPIPQC
jgi:hypothetical protein